MEVIKYNPNININNNNLYEIIRQLCNQYNIKSIEELLILILNNRKYVLTNRLTTYEPTPQLTLPNISTTNSNTNKTNNINELRFYFNSYNNDKEIKKQKFFESKEYLDFRDHYILMTQYNVTFLNDPNNTEKVKQLSKLKEQAFDLRDKYFRHMGIMMYIIPVHTSVVFNEEITNISKKIGEITPQNYKYSQVIFKDNEIVNGYEINDRWKKLYIDYDVFLSFKEIWYDNTSMNYEEFQEEFSNNSCSEWAKIDKYGDYNAGYRNYPEDSYEYQNAWDLTLRDNIMALYNLPYPHKFILHTVSVCCNNHQESVAYSNFLCEWMVRKIYLMNNFTLKQLCIGVVMENELDTSNLPKDIIEEINF